PALPDAQLRSGRNRLAGSRYTLKLPFLLTYALPTVCAASRYGRIRSVLRLGVLGGRNIYRTSGAGCWEAAGRNRPATHACYAVVSAWAAACGDQPGAGRASPGPRPWCRRAARP